MQPTPHAVSTMRYNALAELYVPRKVIIPEWHEVRRNSDTWKQLQTKDIDRSKMSGRLKYHRIINGYSAWDVDKYLGFSKGTYSREFENPYHETSDLNKLKSICNFLKVDYNEIFDDYMSFINSNFPEIFLDFRKKSGYSQKTFAKLIGVDRSVYREWEKGRKKPNRTSFHKIQAFMKNKANTS